MPEIEKLRAEIDEIHVELTRLLQKRLQVTEQIWKIKKSKNLPFFDGKREELIYQKLNDTTNDLHEQNFLRCTFKNILSESKKYLEATLQVEPEVKVK